MYCYHYENLKIAAQSEEGKALLSRAEEIYNEKYKNQPILALNYALWKVYYVNGNRSQYEKMYFERRARLNLLQLLAIKSDEYLEDLENVLAAICEEFSWALPAHSLIADTEEFAYDIVDLFASETGFYLAETVYIFGERLSADIRNRIHISLENRIVKNVEKRRHNWEAGKSNWSAVCTCGVGLTYLYAFPDRFPLVEARLMKAFEGYLSGVAEDGYCSEGVGYWQYGFGFFSLFFDVYAQLKRKHEFLELEKVQKVLNYPVNAEMDDGVYIPFADGGAPRHNLHLGYLYAIKNLFGERFTAPVSLCLDKFSAFPRALGARILYGCHFLKETGEQDKKEKSVYYEKSQVFIYRNERYSFVVKGGYNEELHNHNDVGAFQIVKNQKRLIVDIGAGEYTKEYFNRKTRYKDEIFVCASQSHSVPILDGLTQTFGREYKGQVLEKEENRIVIDLSKAYGGFEGSVIAEYTVAKTGVTVKYRCDGLKEKVVFRFVSECQPKWVNGEVRIDELTLKNKENVAPQLSERSYPGVSGTEGKVYLIDYTFTGKNVEAQFDFIL